MTHAENDPQALLASLGSGPVNPTTPAAEKTRRTLRDIAKVLQTGEYRALAEERAAGHIDREAYFAKFKALFADLERQGRLKE